MVRFIRTDQKTWDNIDRTQYLDSIVFVEDTQQVCVNNVNYFGEELVGIEKIEFSTQAISIEPNKYYFCNKILDELDITLLEEEISTYFIEFMCDDTCVILPSNIKWKNNVVPDFTKIAIMTIKIQDDTAYLIDCKQIEREYLTFTALEDNSSIGLTRLSTNQTLEYSTDATTWNTFDTMTNISLNNGDKVYVRGILSADNTSSNYTQFKMSGKIAASGNCNYIWNYQDLNAPLKKYCGYYIFNNCTSLVTAPELLATTLANNCYNYMFKGCTNLATAPELPATTLVRYCYDRMFWNCKSLITAPKLPATELAESCYYYMFVNCTSLTTAPELPATTLAERCYDGMFYNCTSLVIAPKILPATTLATSCYRGMFYDCTSLTTAPELPATTLAPYCYYEMFDGCTSLNYIKCLATDISATNCTNSWVDGVASTGTFYKHPNMTSWVTGINGIPTKWRVENAEI